jgi:hypothetical protein
MLMPSAPSARHAANCTQKRLATHVGGLNGRAQREGEGEQAQREGEGEQAQREGEGEQAQREGEGVPAFRRRYRRLQRMGSARSWVPDSSYVA